MKQLFLLFSFLTCCLFTACNNNTTEENSTTDPLNTYASNEQYKHHVRSYTAGIISKTTPIRVRFAVDIVSQEMVGKSVAEEILSFSPAIDGVAIWETRSTIKFVPKAWLKTGQRYQVKAELKKVYPDIEPNLATMDFEFQTLKQDFDVEIEGLRESSLADYSTMRLMGVVKTTDAAKAEEVEKMLQLTQKDKKDFAVVWTHTKGNKQHKFTIKKIPTFQEETPLYLSFDGKAIGIDKNYLDTVTVPNQVFKIISVHARGGTELDPYVSVLFSIPLQQIQPVDGLVQIQGYDNTDYYGNSNYRYVINGNELKVYPTRGIEGARQVSVSAGIRSINKTAIAKPSTWDVSFRTMNPEVRLANNGVVIPQTKGLYFPFEAVKLKGVMVEIFKIYEDNVLQFLQQNDLDEASDYSLRHVGRIVAQQHISLQDLKEAGSNQFGWKKYTIALDQWIKEEPGAIYQVRIGFQKEDALCDCLENDNLQPVTTPFERNEAGELESFFDNRDYYYDYENRDNPCKDGYYTSRRFIKQNILGSNIGIIAKRGVDKQLFISTTNLLKGAPSPNIEVKVYDKVRHLLAQKKTNQDGVVQLSTKYEPKFIVATQGKQKGYLSMEHGEALSLSSFQTNGSSNSKGLKGNIYGERGVWRPGDSLFLNFVLEDKRQEIPSNHPVYFSLTDPKGNLFYETTISKNVHGIYDFSCRTLAESPTGYWSAKVVVGGSSFYKDIRIETIKPNRLKIAVDFGKEALKAADTDLKGSIQVDWLHGAPAANVDTKVNLRLAATNTTFEDYKDYEFDDPARRGFDGEPYTIVDKKTAANGKVNISTPLLLSEKPAGFLRAFFSLSATDASGDISTDNFKMPFSPYTSYVGMNYTGSNSNRLEINVENELKFVVVDEAGKPLANQTISVGAYQLKSSWWWDRDDASEVANFNSSTHIGAIDKAILTTNAKGEVTWDFKPSKRGGYLIRACAKASQHCTGMSFYAGNIWDRDDLNNKKSASSLNFVTTKASYEVGETVELNIPGGKSGYALLTLEDGFGVVDYQWVKMEGKEGVQKITFEATKTMAPTIYAYVTLLQPHQEVEEGLPIRSYGVIPIKIVNPKSKLEPVLDMADVLSPNKKTSITVSEANNQPMAYTIAIVDEGLLGLTRFSTPTLWNHFYKKEALGVRSWDMFSDVMSKFELSKILAVGGGGMEAKDGQKANRFKPVVQHLGPFYLAAGQQAKHEIVLPNYIGAVRTMVVAAHEGAYGKADKTTPVRDPLMVLGTMPRVLSPGETLKLPVTVFAMEDQIKEVKVGVATNDKLLLKGANKQTITFDKLGEKLVFFDLEVPNKVGIAKLEIKASSGKATASYAIELDVRNPNPYQSKTYAAVLQPNKKWSQTITPVGMTGTNSAALELSTLPPIDLTKRLNYLILYPYGCIEQTTSAVFPQLVLGNLIPLDKTRATEIETNIRAAIARLQQFQTGTGGFAYWAGDYEVSDWGTNYAGHFLVEAKAKGYPVPANLLKNWIKYQQSQAKNWSPRPAIATNTPPYYISRYRQASLVQAYRLYVLALAGAADIGAMNRMRNAYNISTAAKWKLAAAYAILGQSTVARSIIKDLPTSIPAYQELGYTYGSSLRDEAMILETLIHLKEYTSAGALLQKIAKQLNANTWHSTQTLAYALTAIAKFAGNQKASTKITVAYQIGTKGEQKTTLGNTPMTQINIDIESKNERKIWVQNTSQKPLFVTVATSGKPLTGDTSSSASNLAMRIVYQDLEENKLDPTQLEQGQLFKALVTIENTGLRGTYEEMALNQVFPAGWEITNSRMGGAFQSATGDSPLEYQNIRDDRVYTHFDIPQGKKYTYEFYLTAAYQGTFYMPNVSCGAMYDNTVYAQTAGKWVKVLANSNTAQ